MTAWVVEKHAGIVDKASKHSVDQTVDRLRDMLKANGWSRRAN
jgi:hypothetical protein